MDVRRASDHIIKQKADAARLKLIPSKSADRYMKEMEIFKLWRQTNGVDEVNEDVMLAYVSELSEKYESSSVWTKISMLKKMLLTHENLDVSSYEVVKSFMKRNSSGHIPKQARTFTRDQIKEFLQNAGDDYLPTKVAAIFGIFGGCRREELYDLSVDDILYAESSVIVTIPKTKTGRRRTFSIVDGEDGMDYLGTIRKYRDMRPRYIAHKHFFISSRKGKCTVQRIGINTFGDMGKKMADFLKLPDPSLYTGHAFRRSSATFLADSGADITMFKRHGGGGWKSTSVAERYLDDSLEMKNKIARMILNNSDASLNNVKIGVTKSSSSTVTTSALDSLGAIKFENLHNCTFHLHANDHNSEDPKTVPQD